ncbi:hypothetical protein OTU49_012433 [Cherax quadricarinatus]|uniref:AAA+ ATPase domain-containing protein n=2 Tax=Cherax quadricarinatus TaxID=27406 RepID=A0AAW0VYY8_CHEQU
MGSGDMSSLPTMQTMSILQGLLNMNPAALPGGVPDLAGGLSGPMNPGMAGMGAPMDGGAGSFLSNMPSFLPAMNPEMAGSLAGAFAGGMSALMDGFTGGNSGATIHEYDEDDELLSDEEDEEDEDDIDERVGMGTVATAAAGVAVGGLMAPGILGSHPGHGAIPGHTQHPGNAMLSGHPPTIGFTHGYTPGDMMPSPSCHTQMPHIPTPMHHTNMAPSISGGTVRSVDPLAGMPMALAGIATGASILAPVVNSLSSCGGQSLTKLNSSDTSSVTLVGNDSLNSSTRTLPTGERQVDQSLNGSTRTLPTGERQVDQSLNGSTRTLPTLERQVDQSLNASTRTLPTLERQVDQSLNSSTRTLPTSERQADADVLAATSALEKMHITPQKADAKLPSQAPAPATKEAAKDSKEEVESEDEENEIIEAREEDARPTRVVSPLSKQEAPKSTLGVVPVPGADVADGKSDTESVRKKTPSPVLLDKLGRLSPTGSESTPVLESASCASMSDLASATESMRDSDTDNHSDAHNVTANLSDLDNDLQESQQKTRPGPQYAVGPLPFIIEKPTFGWQCMIGLDTAKEALKNLFVSESFPEVFEGTQGTCKGVLLFGPSGSGKTCLARALAKEANDAISIGISSAYLATQPPHDTPRIVRYMFDHARLHGPAVILFDEVHALSYDRTSETAIRAKAELLAQIRGTTTLHPPYPSRIDANSINEGIMVLGTTNQPWMLEDQLRRIFTYNIHVKLPGEKAREELFRMFLQSLSHTINNDQFKCLVAKSEGYSAADINTVLRQVPRVPASDGSKYIQNVPPPLTYDDLATVMTDYRCGFTEEISVRYQTYIKAATHRTEERRDDSKSDKSNKPKGVRKFGQKIAKSIAAALVAVID